MTEGQQPKKDLTKKDVLCNNINAITVLIPIKCQFRSIAPRPFKPSNIAKNTIEAQSNQLQTRTIGIQTDIIINGCSHFGGGFEEYDGSAALISTCQRQQPLTIGMDQQPQESLHSKICHNSTFNSVPYPILSKQAKTFFPYFSSAYQQQSPVVVHTDSVEELQKSFAWHQGGHGNRFSMMQHGCRQSNAFVQTIGPETADFGMFTDHIFIDDNDDALFFPKQQHSLKRCHSSCPICPGPVQSSDQYHESHQQTVGSSAYVQASNEETRVEREQWYRRTYGTQTPSSYLFDPDFFMTNGENQQQLKHRGTQYVYEDVNVTQPSSVSTQTEFFAHSQWNFL